MLVLTRKKRQSIVIDGRITVTVVHVQGNTIRLGIEAPREVSVRRREIAPLCPEDLDVEITVGAVSAAP
jgi:carbon storage regulator